MPQSSIVVRGMDGAKPISISVYVKVSSNIIADRKERTNCDVKNLELSWNCKSSCYLFK